MHNLYANFVKILDVCKIFSKNLVNELGNVPHRGVVPKFSYLEVIALNLTAENMSIDSESSMVALLDIDKLSNQHSHILPPQDCSRAKRGAANLRFSSEIYPDKPSNKQAQSIGYIEGNRQAMRCP